MALSAANKEIVEKAIKAINERVFYAHSVISPLVHRGLKPDNIRTDLLTLALLGGMLWCLVA